jgi:hypothetical protein
MLLPLANLAYGFHSGGQGVVGSNPAAPTIDTDGFSLPKARQEIFQLVSGSIAAGSRAAITPMFPDGGR